MILRLTPVKAIQLGNVVESKYPSSYLEECIFCHKRHRTPMAAFQAIMVIAADRKRHKCCAIWLTGGNHRAIKK